MLIRVATRGSQLSLIQARIVIDRLKEFNPDLEFQLVIVKTTGDVVTEKPLYSIGVKGIFEKEVNIAVLKGEADIAVHSLKDVPAQVNPELMLAMTPPREDPLDALVSVKGYSLDNIPEGSLVGTSSLRRRGFILYVRPNLRVAPVRGNVDTRLRKMLQGQYDALVMASAGLKRINAQVPYREIPPDVMPPAPGQGIIGVFVRRDRDDLVRMLLKSSDGDAMTEAIVERAILTRIGAGCHVPLGVLARVDGGKVDVVVGLVDPDGRERVIVDYTGDAKDPEYVGLRASEELVKKGRDLLERLKLYRLPTDED